MNYRKTSLLGGKMSIPIVISRTVVKPVPLTIKNVVRSTIGFDRVKWTRIPNVYSLIIFYP